MKKKKINAVKLIIGICVVIYMLFNSEYLDDLKANLENTKEVINDNISNTMLDNTTNLQVYVLDVGQADSILIKSNDKYALIDAGCNETGDELVSYLESLGIEKFEHVITTHPHEDHIGGMDNIIKNFDVNNFYMPDILTTTKTFEDVLNALEVKNLQYTTPNIDDKFYLNDAIFTVLYLDNNEDNLNDSSIILRLEYGNNSFLFMADASSEVEEKILNKNIKSDVLKVGHHGSEYSSSNEFLKKVGASYAAISVGTNNSYNHPSNLVLKRLEKNNMKIYRTDTNGTIVFNSDKENITVNNIKTNINE